MLRPGEHWLIGRMAQAMGVLAGEVLKGTAATSTPIPPLPFHCYGQPRWHPAAGRWSPNLQLPARRSVPRRSGALGRRGGPDQYRVWPLVVCTEGIRAVATAFPQAQVERWATDLRDEHWIGLQTILPTGWCFDGQRPIALVHPRSARYDLRSPV